MLIGNYLDGQDPKSTCEIKLCSRKHSQIEGKLQESTLFTQFFSAIYNCNFNQNRRPDFISR